MKGLSTLDLVVLLVYLAAIAGIGSSFYRRKSTARDYFLGGRSMSWIPVGISIIAADLSAISVMGTPAWAYQHNLDLLWSSAGFLIVAPLVILIFVPFYARLNLYTAYEYLERRFNLPVRIVCSALFQILRGLHVAVVIYAPSLVISMVTGLPVWQCTLLMGGFTTVYTTLGGMKAVIWTDVIQFCTVTLGIVLIFVIALSQVPGGLPAAYRTAAAAGRLDAFNFSLDPKELTSFWACIIGGLVLCMGPMTTDQAILQRLFTTKSERDCRRSILLQAVVVMPVSIMLFLSGTALYVFYRFNPGKLVGLKNVDAIVPFFAVRELPSGVSGLIVACILSASMAVMSAGINALTTATTVDFYQRLWRPAATSEHYAQAGRVGTLCWGVVVTVLALFARHLGELALAYNKVSSVISGPLLGIFLLGTTTRRATATGALTGAVAGILVVGAVMSRSEWSFFWLGPIGVVTTYFVGLGASLFTTAPERRQIDNLVIGHRSSLGKPESARLDG
ncbi:MAG: sodium/solute symporter [Acidobacteria bacterium]|nr:sodium/solute symporter [Acidobacteriota bacterium]